MKLKAWTMALAVFAAGCGDDGSSGGGEGGGGQPSGATIVMAADVDGDGNQDLATIDTGAPPGQRVTDVVTKDPVTGIYNPLPTGAVSGDLLQGVLTWDATTPVGPANRETTITIRDNGTPKAVIVRRLP